MAAQINIHTHSDHSSGLSIFNVKLKCNLLNYRHCSIGIHPWEISNIDIDASLNWVANNSTNKKVAAIGEVGIDRAIKTELTRQIEVFKLQHAIAQRVKKPILIHCVRAYSDMLALLKELKPSVVWVFHGFSANKAIAMQLVANGCYLSFGKALLCSEKVQSVFKEIPLDNIFFETDESDIDIELIYKKGACLKQISINEIKEKIYNNYLKVFTK